MPKVSSPGELGIGRGAGKLGALNLPQRRSTATPATFGAGLMEQRYSPEAFGAGLEYHPYKPAQSGFELLADAVSKIASIGSETAEKVNDANNASALMQMKLQASTSYTEQNLAREATVEEGKDPGDDYAKRALADFDSWSAKQTEGLAGIQKAEMEQHYGQLKMSLMNEATNFQASRKRQYRQIQNEISADAMREGIASAQNVVFNNPGLLETTLADFHAKIDALQVADDVKADLHRDAAGALANARWARKVQDDPYGARDILKVGDPAQLGGLEFKELAGHLSHAETKINAIESEARQQQAEANAAARAAQTAAELRQRMDSLFLGDQVDRATDAMESGLPVDPAKVGALAEQTRVLAQSASDPDTARRAALQHEKLQAGADTQEFSKAFAGASRLRQDAWLTQRRAQPMDPDDLVGLGEFKKATKIVADSEQAVRENRILERSNELGIVQLTPLEVTDPTSLHKRIFDARMTADHFGTRVEMFTPAERAAEAARVGAMRGEQKAQYMADLQRAAGDAYPDVIRELGLKGGLDREARYMSLFAGRPEEGAVANAVGEAINTEPKDLKVNLLKFGSSYTEAQLDRDIDTKLRKWQESVGPTYATGSAGAQEMLTDVHEAAKGAALVLMRTMSYDEAIRKAADGIINNRYEFREGYRIPKPPVGGDAYTARFDQMLADTMTALTPEMVTPLGSPAGVDEATRRFGYLEAVRNRGRWATLPDESGVVRLDEEGNVVIAAGKPVIVKF